MNLDHTANASSVTQQRSILAALCVIVLSYCWAVFHYSRNAPYVDDILEALAFTEQYATATGFTDKTRLFFISLNEHITAVNHTVYLLWYHLTGSLNFRHFMWVGNAFVIATALVVNRGLRIGLQPFAIVVFLFVLNLQIWESTFWAMTSLSNQGVLLFAALCFLTLDRQRVAFWPAVTCATIAVFTQANGLLVPLVVVLALGIENYRQRLPIINRPVIAWLIIFVALLALYKGIYHQMFSNNTPSLAIFIASVQDSPLRLPIFFFSLLGSWTFTTAQLLPSVVTGILIAALLCRFFQIQLRRDNTAITTSSFFLLAFTLYILLSCVLITAGRGAFLSIDFALTSRYKMYSIFLVLILLHQLACKTWLKTAIIAALCSMLMVANVQRIPDIALRNQQMHDTYYNWMVDGGFGRANTLLIAEQDAYFFDGYKSGIYSAYSAVGNVFKPATVQTEAACADIPTQANKGNSAQAFSRQEKSIGIELTLHVATESLATVAKPDILLCSATHSYRITLRPASQQLLMDTNNLKLLLLKQQFRAGHYQVWLQGVDVRVELGDVGF